jgi:hypothetical protein
VVEGLGVGLEIFLGRRENKIINHGIQERRREGNLLLQETSSDNRTGAPVGLLGLCILRHSR